MATATTADLAKDIALYKEALSSTPQYTYKAKVIDVHDGDTITVEIDVGFHITVTTPLRLQHYDSPELSTERGKEVRDILKERILGKEVTVKTYKDPKDKYGRWLAVVFYRTKSLNKWMVEKGYGTPYEGGKKPV